MSCKSDCRICLCEVTDPVRLCSVCDEAFCRACLSQYIDSLVRAAFQGSCPSITCPSLSHQSRKTILPMSQWATIVSEDCISCYHALASELLSMRCGECHQVSSQLVAHDPDVSCEFLLSTSCPEEITEALAFFHVNVALFCAGDMSIDDFYQAVVHEHFPVLQVNDDDAAWDMFSAVLKSIEEPERRSNLQLRYYRDRPCMRTVCCNAEHCFQCAMYGFHHGQSCMEVRDALDNTIVQCPTCTVALVKSEGCDTIQCVCGSVLNWEDELGNIDECQRFLQLYPVQPSVACARILCTGTNTDAAVDMARAWRERHPIDVNRALVDWFRTRFAPCPSQACLTLVEAEQTEGVVLAMGLWRAEHAAEVARCRAQSDLAVASLFLTMQPRAADRAMTARRFLTSAGRDLPVNRLMRRSMEMWIKLHREEYDRGVAEWQQRSAQQLLLRFGSYSLPHMRPLEHGHGVSRQSGFYAVLTEISNRKGGAPASLVHFDALCDPSELPALSTAVPYNAGNSLRWLKLLVLLEAMVADLEDGSATAVPESVLVTDGSRWLARCSSSVCVARERAQDVLAAMREFLRIRRFGARGAPVSLEPLRSTPLKLVLDALSWLFHDRARPVTMDWGHEAAASVALVLADAPPQLMQMCA